jgi:hypothetical protein
MCLLYLFLHNYYSYFPGTVLSIPCIDVMTQLYRMWWLKCMGCDGSVVWDVMAQMYGMWCLNCMGCDGSIALDVMAQLHRWKRLQMWKVIVVIILYKFLSALLRLESKLIVAACRDGSVIRGISQFVHCLTQASQHAATISLDSSLKRAERHLYKIMTTITFHICNLFHLCSIVWDVMAKLYGVWWLNSMGCDCSIALGCDGSIVWDVMAQVLGMGCSGSSAKMYGMWKLNCMGCDGNCMGYDGSIIRDDMSLETLVRLPQGKLCGSLRRRFYCLLKSLNEWLLINVSSTFCQNWIILLQNEGKRRSESFDNCFLSVTTFF